MRFISFFKTLLFFLSFFVFLGSFFITPINVSATSNTVENALLGPDTETNHALNNQGYTNPSKLRNPVDIAIRIIYVIEGLLGIIFVILLLYGGFIWMTAGGDDKKVEESIKLLRNAVIGLIIVLSVWTLSYFIIDQLGKAASR